MTSGVITATVSAAIDLVNEDAGTGLTTGENDQITLILSGIDSNDDITAFNNLADNTILH